MRNRKMRIYPPIIVSVVVMLLALAMAAHAIITEASREAAEPQVTDWAASYPVFFTTPPAVSETSAESTEPPEEPELSEEQEASALEQEETAAEELPANEPEEADSPEEEP